MSGEVPVSSEQPVGGGRHRHLRREGGRRAVKVVCVLAAVLSVGAFMLYGYAWYNYTSLDQKLQRRAIDVVPVTTPSGGDARERHVNGAEQNILIVGDDSRDGLTRNQQKALHVGSDSGTDSTDTIMIVHVPADGSKATLISIPRDSWVEVPGYGMGKINSAYGDGYRNASGADPSTKDRQKAGADTLVATVSKLTGISINHYIQVGFGGFYTIAKAIDGIDVTLCESVDDTVSRNQVEGQIAGSGFKMSAGHHHLDATQSLEFVRQRHNLPGPNGNDIGREQRQRYFLAQAVSKIASTGLVLNPVKLHTLINTITAAFFIDGSFSLQNFADQMLDLNSQHIVGQTIPIANVNGQIGNQSVVLVDPATVRAKVAKIIATGAAPRAVPGSTGNATASTTPSAKSSGSAGSKTRTTAKNCIY